MLQKLYSATASDCGVLGDGTVHCTHAVRLLYCDLLIVTKDCAVHFGAIKLVIVTKMFERDGTCKS